MKTILRLILLILVTFYSAGSVAVASDKNQIQRLRKRVTKIQKRLNLITKSENANLQSQIDQINSELNRLEEKVGSFEKTSDTTSALAQDTSNKLNALEANSRDFLTIVYGDGSAGDKLITSDTTLQFQINSQYRDIVVSAGTTLTVPAGSKIRCSGSFTNNGTIIVDNTLVAGSFRYLELVDGSLINPFLAESAGYTYVPQHRGRTGLQDETGIRIADANFNAGGVPGKPVTPNSLRFNNATHCGRGGGSTRRFSYNGFGGGIVTIACKNSVVNSADGLIEANGAPTLEGNGGGSGGIIVLASSGTVTNLGAVVANGSDGANSHERRLAAGGGGGGGLIHLVAPTINNTGVIELRGGSGGAAMPAGSFNDNATGGSAGGSCGGTGGKGGTYNPSDHSSTAGASGRAGLVKESLFDPLPIIPHI